MKRRSFLTTGMAAGLKKSSWKNSKSVNHTGEKVWLPSNPIAMIFPFLLRGLLNFSPGVEFFHKQAKAFGY